MNKQIEYMGVITDLLIDFDEMSFAPTTACPDPEAYAIEWREKITNALKGYLKASEVAREIFAEIERYLRLNEDIAIKCKEENGEQNREYFKGKLAAYLQIRGFVDVELKRQYKEGRK